MRIQKTVLITLVLSLILTVVSMAMSKVEPVQATETPVMEEVVNVDENDPYGVGLPDVTTDDISQWIDRKGFEIIGILQRFAQPFAIVMFIVCGLITFIGAFGNGKTVSRGIVGMVTTAVVYIVVMYAPEIMDIFLNFVRS